MPLGLLRFTYKPLHELLIVCKRAKKCLQGERTSKMKRNRINVMILNSVSNIRRNQVLLAHHDIIARVFLKAKMKDEKDLSPSC
jgi:hypothetical protein